HAVRADQFQSGQQAALAVDGQQPRPLQIDRRAVGQERVDLHVVVPEFWSVDRAHDEMDAYEARVRLKHASRVELQFHVDPCQRSYCARCDFEPCAVRAAKFAAARRITGQTVLRGPEPAAPGDRVVPPGA
ncbi:MAG: hypothetical protein K8T90_13555, partial [Planctomycetes bacterium]|nr:hypothetical protein [Planctomycetota bacterium]